MYELDKAAFGHFLAQLRREKGMTQKELARSEEHTSELQSR